MDLDAVADAPRPAGLGLDIGVLDEGGLERALGDRGAVGEGVAASPRLTPPSSSRFLGLSACTSGASGAVAASTPYSGGSGVQAIGISSSRIASTSARAPTSASTASPRKRTEPVGQHGLVLDVGIDAEAVERHVGRRQHRREPRAQRREVAHA